MIHRAITIKVQYLPIVESMLFPSIRGAKLYPFQRFLKDEINMVIEIMTKRIANPELSLSTKVL